MALNFPIPTSVGQVYQDPTSGNTYVCTSLGPPAQWVGSGSSTSLDSTYLRTDASNDPVTGNLLLNPTTNVSPLTLQQPVGNTTPALKIENSGSGNSIEANGFAVSETGVLTLGTALAIANGGTGATTQSAARTNLGATTVGEAVFTAVDEAAGRLAIGAMSNTAPEIITNANGTAYRWPNGLQICAHATSISLSTVSSYDYDWTFPAAFTTLLGLSGLIQALEQNIDYRNGLVYHSRSSSSTTVGRFHVRTTGGVGTQTNFNWIAPRVLAIGTYTP